MCLFKKNKKDEAWEKRREEISNEIFAAGENFIKVIRERYPLVEETNWFIANFGSYRAYNWLSALDDTIEDLEYKWKAFVEFNEKNLLSLDKINERILDNIKNGREFVKDPSLFFVTYDAWEHPEYYFAYEMCVSDDGKKIIAIVTDTNKDYAYKKEFGLKDYSFQSMNKDEFERHFLIERLNRMCGLTEKEVVDYSNYLRNLFNQTQK